MRTSIRMDIGPFSTCSTGNWISLLLMPARNRGSVTGDKTESQSQLAAMHSKIEGYRDVDFLWVSFLLLLRTPHAVHTNIKQIS